MAAGPLALFALQRTALDTAMASGGPFAPSQTLTSEKFYEFPVREADGRLMNRQECLQRLKKTNRDRIEALRALAAEHRAASSEISNHASSLSRLASGVTPVTLPALTGEENTHELLPRGQILCAGESLGTVIAQAMIATAFGNDVILLQSRAANEVAAKLNGTCRVVDTVDAVRVVRGDIAGIRPVAVLVESSQRNVDAIQAAAMKQMADVVFTDVAQKCDWTKFVRERITTVNASAAGGNTQLMVMSEDGF